MEYDFEEWIVGSHFYNLWKNDWWSVTSDKKPFIYDGRSIEILIAKMCASTQKCNEILDSIKDDTMRDEWIRDMKKTVHGNGFYNGIHP